MTYFFSWTHLQQHRQPFSFTIHRNNTRDSGFLTSSPLLSLFLSILSSSLSLALCVNGKVRSSTHSRVLDITSPLLLFLQGHMLISSHWSLWATRWMDWWPRYSFRRIYVKFQPWVTLFSIYYQKYCGHKYSACATFCSVSIWFLMHNGSPCHPLNSLIGDWAESVGSFSRNTEWESFCWNEMANTI